VAKVVLAEFGVERGLPQSGGAKAQTEELYLRSRWYLLLLAGGGAAAFGIGQLLAPERAWANLLLANFYFLCLALFGLIFVGACYVLSAGWAVVFRRLPEAMSAYLPIGALLALVLFVGRGHLYPWARPEVVAAEAHLQHKAAYLNSGFFLARLVFAFAVWMAFAAVLRYHSRRQDESGAVSHTRSNQIWSAFFLLALALTFVFSSIDWIMSLEPKWYSTIFPVYCGAGLLLGGTAALSVLLIYARRRGVIPGVTDNHINELSRLICASGTFWAYVWFSQFMLIYYTNIPEETVYFVRRVSGGWLALFYLNPILNWLLPLIMLIPAGARRSSRWLWRAAVLVLVGRWLDLYLLVMPALHLRLQVGLVEALLFGGIGALFLLALLRSFRSASPVPHKDPYLVESLHLRV